MKFKSIFFMALGLGLLLMLALKLWNDPERILKNDFKLCVYRNSPGATDRYTTFTFYDCGDPAKKPIHDPIGADWAELKMKDIDSDGQPEVIIESNIPWYSGACASPSRSTWKLLRDQAGQISMKELSREALGDSCEEPSSASEDKEESDSLTLQKTVKVQNGNVELWSNRNSGIELRLNNKKIFEDGTPIIGSGREFAYQGHLKGADVLVLGGYGGDGCLSVYELIVIWQKGKTHTQSFGNCSSLEPEDIIETKSEIQFRFFNYTNSNSDDPPSNASTYIFDGKTLKLAKGPGDIRQFLFSRPGRK